MKENKTAFLHIRLTETEKLELELRARKCNLTMSEYVIRECIERELEYGKEE